MNAVEVLALPPSLVQAIQEGRKTTHRVPVSPQPINDRVGMVNAAYCGHPGVWLVDGLVSEYHDTGRPVPKWRCPYPPGTLIAVQEPWNREGGLLSFLQDGDWIAEYGKGEPASYLARKAQGTAPAWQDADSMALEDCRLTLMVTAVRAEQLQKVSQAQAVAEGIQHNKRAGLYWTADSVDHRDKQTKDPREAYCWQWESQGTPYMWRSNPWVWVLEFSVFEQDVSQ